MINRDPNINIKYSDLKKVFDILDMPKDKILRFVEECKKYRCTNRTVINVNARVKKKIERALKVTEHDTELFIKLLLAARSDENHNLNFIKHVTKGTRDYTNLSEGAVIAVEFAESFEMERTDGMQEFIKMAIPLMRRKFALNKFKSLSGKIFEAKRIKGLMQGEGLKRGAKVARIYFAQLEKETKQKYQGDIPDDVFVNFIYAYEELERAKATVSDWIHAQFAGLAFMDVLPEINQLHGDGAIKRYIDNKFGKPVNKNGKTETEIDVGMMDADQLAYFKGLKI